MEFPSVDYAKLVLLLIFELLSLWSFQHFWSYVPDVWAIVVKIFMPLQLIASWDGSCIFLFSCWICLVQWWFFVRIFFIALSKRITVAGRIKVSHLDRSFFSLQYLHNSRSLTCASLTEPHALIPYNICDWTKPWYTDFKCDVSIISLKILDLESNPRNFLARYNMWKSHLLCISIIKHRYLIEESSAMDKSLSNINDKRQRQRYER